MSISTIFSKTGGRKLHLTWGDGNCLFLTIRYGGSPHPNKRPYHQANLNPDYSLIIWCLWTSKQSGNKQTIREKVKHMSHPSVWGTHLEIKVAATLLQFPIYYYTQAEFSGAFNWNIIMPISTSNIKFWILKEKEDINHIELYYQSSHYKVILSIDSGKVCGISPQLTGKTDSQPIDLTNWIHKLHDDFYEFHYNSDITIITMQLNVE